MEKMSRLALFCAITGLVFDIFAITPKSVPLGIPLGIFGIAFSTLCKEPDSGRISRKGRISLILSAVSLILGLLDYVMILAYNYVMSDPKMSREMLRAFESLKDSLPEDMQRMLEQSGTLPK